MTAPVLYVVDDLLDALLPAIDDARARGWAVRIAQSLPDARAAAADADTRGLVVMGLRLPGFDADDLLRDVPHPVEEEEEPLEAGIDLARRFRARGCRVYALLRPEEAPLASRLCALGVNVVPRAEGTPTLRAVLLNP